MEPIQIIGDKLAVTFLSQCQQIVKVDVSSELELCLVAVRGWHECADCAI
jgi:hypothetical protein